MNFLILVFLYWLAKQINLPGISSLADQLLYIAIILYGIRLLIISVFPPRRNREDDWSDYL